MNYLVIGESSIDVFVYGTCKRFSPEAPVPVFEPTNTLRNYGMAHNVYHNIKSIVSQRKDIKKIGGKSNIVTCKDKPVKTRYIDEKSNHMFIRVDVKDHVPKIKLTNEIKRQILDASDIIVSDYNKGFLDSSCIKEICNLSFCARIYLDTKRLLTKEICESVDFIKLNTSEYNNQLKNEESSRCLLDYDDKIIVTDSTGATHKGLHYTVDKVYNTIDVSGAGDTFIAAFALHNSMTLSIEESIHFANVCASDVVSKRGINTPTYSEKWDEYISKNI